jgi:hypothetical protein
VPIPQSKNPNRVLLGWGRLPGTEEDELENQVSLNKILLIFFTLVYIFYDITGKMP